MYNTIWNPHHHKKLNGGPLKTFIEIYKLFINNNPNYITCQFNVGILIINLAFNSLKLGSLYIRKITEKYFSPSNYEFILVEWDKIEEKILKF